MNDEDWMRQAIGLAQQAEAVGEVPVGAVIVLNNEAIGTGFNQPIKHNDPTSHAEIVALRAAAKHMSNYRIPGATLYVTLEPCLMCAGAMLHARIERLVYGAPDPKTGVIDSHQQVFKQHTALHQIQVSRGVLTDECGDLLSAFFKAKRVRKS